MLIYMYDIRQVALSLITKTSINCTTNFTKGPSWTIIINLTMWDEKTWSVPLVYSQSRNIISITIS